MASQAKLLIVQFLEWAADGPRRRADVRDAWQSTCPLNSAWEDAISDNLVTFDAGGYLTLTAHGRAVLASAKPEPATTIPPHRL